MQNANLNKFIIFIARFITRRPISVKELQQIRSLDWDAVQNLIAYHELAPFAYLAFRESKIAAPSKLHELLRNTYYYEIKRSQELWHECSFVIRNLQKEGIESLPLKGMALLEDVYAKIPARPMADIDILVRGEDVEKSVNVLEDAGYKLELLGCKKEYWRERQIHFTFLRKQKKRDCLVELHWGLDFKRKGRVVLPEIWQRVRSITRGDTKIMVLSPEDTLFSLALHARRFGNSLCLKNAFDSLLLLDKYENTFDWAYCLNMCDKYELHSTLYFLLYQVNLLSVRVVPDSVFTGLKVSSSKKTLIQCFINSNTFSAGISRAVKRLYLISHFLLYDTLKESAQYVINIPQEQFAEYYGLKKYDQRTEFLYKIRILYILFSVLSGRVFGKRRRVFAKPITVTNNPRAVNLSFVRVSGWSMYPNIVNGDCVLLKKKNIHVGDVVCFKYSKRISIMHRVVNINNNYVTTRGDNTTANDTERKIEDIKGIAIAVKRGGSLYPVRNRRFAYSTALSRLVVTGRRSAKKVIVCPVPNTGFVYPPELDRFVMVARRAVNKIIVYIGKSKIYHIFTKAVSRHMHIELTKPVESGGSYFVRAKVNGFRAGHIKFIKEYNLLELHVKIWFKMLGVEDKLFKLLPKLQHIDYNQKTQTKNKYHRTAHLKTPYRRYYKIAGVNICLYSDLQIKHDTFRPAFKAFESDGPGKDTISIHHHFYLPELKSIDLGKEIYRKSPWAIYKRGDSWTYLLILCKNNNRGLYRAAVFDKGHTHARIYSTTEDIFLQGGLHSLTLLPTDQILLARILTDRNGCYLHSCGVNYRGRGLLFVGHSEAGKSSIANMLKGKAEVLCDDRIIVRRQPDGFRIYGTWSHGDVEDISADSAPLRAILFLDKTDNNSLIPMIDKNEAFKRILACLIRPLVTVDWWNKSLSIIKQIAEEVPCYILQFDRSGKMAGLLMDL